MSLYDYEKVEEKTCATFHFHVFAESVKLENRQLWVGSELRLLIDQE